MIFFIPLSAFADQIPYGKITSVNVSKYDLEYKPSQSSIDSFLSNSKTANYDNVQPIIFISTDGSKILRIVAWKGQVQPFRVDGGILYPNADIWFLDRNSSTNSGYASDKYPFTSGVESFFIAPTIQIPVAEMAGPEEIPRVVMVNLLDGGILLAGLVILGSWLVVGLVRRLPFWFLR